jgi:hypothetical protein
MPSFPGLQDQKHRETVISVAISRPSMPGRSSDSTVGQVLGAAVALLAVGLFVLDSTTDTSVPYGYDGSAFLLGAAVAVVAVVAVVWRYRDAVLG